ncbi:MAG: N-acetyltransferase [Phycisphaerae bacterium]|nr:N-acetyltransferase [Phycisphaerae bacterium]
MHLIRPTEQRDFEQMAQLVNRFISDTVVHFGYAPVSAAELRSQWDESRARYPWLTLELDGDFGGFAKAGVWRSREAYRWTAEVGLYLVESARGRGLGTAIYRELLDDLRRRGFHSAIGGVTLPNEASVRLHERLGFEFVGRFRHAGYKFGGWHDVGFWQVVLADASHRPGSA